mmetsp:Transcript_90632/g.151629  ORF Transcript_90632/g.151629 Transcript_90632/m.151629 type:complete len:380 (-) Transcript_90632:447-1586(-)
MGLPARPAMMRSMASSTSRLVMVSLFRRPARMAASLSRLLRSAPEKPGVRMAMVSMEMSASSGLFAACTPRIALRPRMSGVSTVVCRSNRPGRSSAGSKMSERLVAASTITPVLPWNPSISVRIWFRVCSRSSFPWPTPAPRERPTASISSMKMRHGAFSPAFLKRSRTRLAPTPTNISTNSDPEQLKNGTPASPATALANSVLPVPGGPVRSTPLGIFAPTAVYFSGAFRNSTTSTRSCLASSTPATSLNVTPVLGSISNRAFVFPSPNPGWPPPPIPPCARRERRNSPPSSSSGNARLAMTPARFAEASGPATLTATPFCAMMRSSSGSLGAGIWTLTNWARLPSSGLMSSASREVRSVAKRTSFTRSKSKYSRNRE